MSRQCRLPGLAWSARLLLVMWSVFAGTAFAALPVGLSTTLEGCRNDGSPAITLPNSSGEFICPNAAYTTGNLGKGWSELDLVPYRITMDAGNSAPATQTYTVAVVLDHMDASHPGYDVLSAPKLNASLSASTCTAPTVGPESIAAPGVGGIDESLYRLVTITQARNTKCVYDYYGRLALGSHLFPGSSLHANLTNETLGTSGVGARDVSIPVKEIAPQELRKDMSATQDKDYHWTLSKSPSPATISFGDVCLAEAPKPQEVTFRVEWTRSAAIAGTVHVTTHVYAKNPAARTITVNVADSIYAGATPTGAPLDVAASGPIDVPANTELLVLTHTAALPAGANVGGSVNDVATATYTDKVTGVPVPGTTQATATATIEAGTITDATAGIRDVESMTGTGLTFSVLDPGIGGFVSYTPGTPTTGPVKWGSGAQTTDGYVDFKKTLYLDTKRITSGLLTDTANLLASDGFTTSAGPINVKITSDAFVELTISKEIPLGMDAGEKIEITFHVTRNGDASYSRDETLTFLPGDLQKSVKLTGLVPDIYTVQETSAWFYPAGCNDTSCRKAAPLVPDGGDQQTANLQAGAGGVISACAATTAFVNSVPNFKLAEAQVQKITYPALGAGDPDYSWTFKLFAPSDAVNPIATVVAGAGAGFVNFGVKLAEEGTYRVVEQTKSPTWTLNGATPNDGVNKTVCSFTVDYFDDVGKLFSCTFTNTKQGKAKVVKTVQGAGPTGTQSFTFQLRKDATSTAVGTTLETGVANAGNGGVINFSTLLVPKATYQMCEIVLAGWTSTLGTFVPGAFLPPDGVPTNPNVDNSIVCVDFTVQPGETKTFTVDNTPPPGGRALTIGFWKNWASCKQSGGKQVPVLDQTMAAATPPGIQVDSMWLVGDPLNVNSAPDCKKAVALLDKSTYPTCGNKKMASDPLFNMAAQLVAAELNLAAGAYRCGTVLNAVASANTLLTKYKFNGCTHDAITVAADVQLANSLATLLDNYNNNRPGVCQ